MKKQVEPSAKKSAIQRWRLMRLRSGPNRVEVRSELLELVADPGRLLEAEIVGRCEHLLLELYDELLELLRGLGGGPIAAAPAAAGRIRLHRKELRHVGDPLLHRGRGDAVLLVVRDLDGATAVGF